MHLDFTESEPGSEESIQLKDLLVAYIGGCLDGIEDEESTIANARDIALPSASPRISPAKPRGRPPVEKPAPVIPKKTSTAWVKGALTLQQFLDVKQCQKDGLTSLQTTNEMNIPIAEVNQAYSMPDFNYYLNHRK